MIKVPEVSLSNDQLVPVRDAIHADAELLKPRLYQLKLFELAKRQNVIAVLDTGAGKTLISIMLIKHMASLEQTRREEAISVQSGRKITFFLVNTVPLGLQQARVIRQHTHLSVGRYYGEMNIDMWSSENWKAIYANVDVLVVTAQVLYDLLVHGFVSLRQINLLIFDEAHHCRKNHPFNGIMREFYDHTPADQRPKIFSMTASPLTTGCDLEAAIQDLEIKLDSKVLTVHRSNYLDLEKAAPKANEFVFPYDAVVVDTCIDSPKIQWLHKQAESDPPLAAEFGRLADKFEMCTVELGEWAAEKAMDLELSSIYALLTGVNKSVTRNFSRNKNERLPPTSHIFDSLSDTGKLSLIQELKILLAQPLPTLSRNTMTPKTDLLLKILKKYYKEQPDNFSCMVFVQERITARLLCELVQEYPLVNKILRPGLLIGHTNDTFRSTQPMKSSHQHSVLTKFGSGEHNVIFATSVGEEGLDIQVCSLVVRFDMFGTYIEYVQSRGRARHEDSKFVVMAEKNSPAHSHTLHMARATYDKMDAWMKENGQLCDSIEDLALDDDLVAEPDYDGVNLNFSEPLVTEKACVSLNSSVRLLYYYCSVQKREPFSPVLPTFNYIADGMMFTATVTLPGQATPYASTSHLMVSKKAAKRFTALEACRKLHAIGELDDYLLPHNRVDPNEISIDKSFLLTEDNALESAKGIKIDATYDSLNVWYMNGLNLECNDETTTLYLHRVEFGDDARSTHKSIGILFVKAIGNIPSFPLYTGAKTTVTTLQDPVTVKLSEADLSKLRRYNSIALRYLFLKRRDKLSMSNNSPDYTWIKEDFSTWDEDYACLIVPMDRDAIDWPDIEVTFTLETSRDGSMESSSLAAMLARENVPKNYSFVVADLLDYQKRCAVESILPDVTPMNLIDPVELATLSRVTGKPITYKDFYKRARCKIPYTEISLPSIDEDQPLANLTRLNFFQNHLRPISEGTKEIGKLPEGRLSQFLMVSPFSGEMFRSCSLLPSIFNRIEMWNAVLEFERTFPDLGIKREYLLEALVCPGTNIGFSYERLETLGDAFLKVGYGLHFFVEKPEGNEGVLSPSRHKLVSNKSLYQRSAARNLPKFIWNRPVNAKNWTLPFKSDKTEQVSVFTGAESKRSKAWKNSEFASNPLFLSHHTVADVFEALMGAALLTNGFPLAMTVAEAFGLPFDDKHCFEDYMPQIRQMYINRHPKPTSELNMVSVSGIENILGYKFRHPWYLVEALNHGSSHHTGIPSYQRMEFLGDSVLDYIVIRHLFEINRYPIQNGFPQFVPNLVDLAAKDSSVDERYLPLDPGKLTHIKAMVVKNTTLAAACTESQLHKHLLYFSNPLFQAIKQYSEYISLGQECADLPAWWYVEGDETFDRMHGQLVTMSVDDDNEDSETVEHVTLLALDAHIPRRFSISAMSTPKPLSDTMEAMIAAVFLDSDLSLEVTWNVVDNLLRLTKYSPPEAGVQLEGIELETRQYLSLWKSLSKWITENFNDAMYGRLDPARKVTDWLELRNCHGVHVWTVPRKRVCDIWTLTESQIAAPVKVSVDVPAVLQRFSEARASITDNNTPFTRPTIAIYLHDLLIGIAEGDSLRFARACAAEAAFVTIQKWITGNITIQQGDGLTTNLVRVASGSKLHLNAKCCHMCTTKK